MRLLKVLLVGLFAVFAIVAGVVTAAAVAVGGLLIIMVRRLLGGQKAAPLAHSSPRSRPPAGDQEVIDISATEVTHRESEPASENPDLTSPLSRYSSRP